MDYYKKYIKYKVLFKENPTNQKYFKKYKYYKYKIKFLGYNYQIVNIDLTDDIQYIILELENKNKRFLQTVYEKIPKLKDYISYSSIVSKIKSEKFLNNLDKVLVNLIEIKNKFINGDLINKKDIEKLVKSGIDFISYFISSFMSLFFPTSSISYQISNFSDPILSFINLYGDLYSSEVIENNNIIIKKYNSEKRQIIDNKKYKYREKILLSINELVDYIKKLILESLLNNSDISYPPNFEKNIIEKIRNLILNIGLGPKIIEKILSVISNEINLFIEAEKKKKNNMNIFNRIDMSRFNGNDMSRFNGNDMSRFNGNDMSRFNGNDMSRFNGNVMSRFNGNDMSRFNGNDMSRFKKIN